ncbi:MAG: glycoside hydrolase family 1 protein [Nitrososphaeraceae archaeon]|nr:glycoside hydrolase family 1 protein [Nitrososphaeraceae archaeon]
MFIFELLFDLGMEGSKYNFLWGIATSSYQVEGGISNNDWDYFTRSDAIKKRISSLTKPSIFYKGRTQIHLQPAGEAVKFWEPEYYESDFQLAKSLGMNAFRISLEWARIQPKKDQWNQEALDHYKKMLRSMRKGGLTPIVTLNHFTLPLWVLTPPDKITKNIVQLILPSPLRDAPIGEPPSTDPYWNSLRGWENDRTVKEFVKFTERIVLELKDLVDYWITINEPVASIVGLGYIGALSPPGFFLDGKRAKLALHNLIEAHIQAYDKITELDLVDADGDGLPKRVGLGHLMTYIIPAKPNSILGKRVLNKSNHQAAENASYFLNDYFLNAVIKGEEDVNYLNTLKIHDKTSKDFLIHDNWKNKVDFIGLNYYRRIHVYHSIVVALSSARFIGGAFINDLNEKTWKSKSSPDSYGMLNDLGWEIYPQGIYELVMRLTNKYAKPIFVTENGIADKHDRYRGPFIVAHIEQIKRAIDNGANVIGYLHWSMMDNYEWQESYRPEAKFGLFKIDKDSKNSRTDREQHLKRQVTKGAEVLKLIIKESVKQGKTTTIADSAISRAKTDYGIFTADGSSIVLPT